MKPHTYLIVSTSLSALIAGGAMSPAHAEPAYVSLPAVSGLNGKIAGLGGTIDDERLSGVTGSVSFPIGERFGAQIDGMVGDADGRFHGVAGHFFWRDPGLGLLGVYGSHVSWDYDTTRSSSSLNNGLFDTTGADVSRIGVEGHLYLDRFSLEGLAGHQSGSFEGYFGRGTLAFYATDDLRFDVSFSDTPHEGTTGAVGVELALGQNSSVSFFADGSFSSDDDRFLAGLKFYLAAEPKSLIRRHREDDPDNELPLDLFRIVGDDYCPAGSLDLGKSGTPGPFCDGNL